MITSRAASEPTPAGSIETGFPVRAPLACRWWSNVALTCVAGAIAVLVAATLARPDLSAIENSLSNYAIGPWWFLQTAAFLAIGGASAALGMALLFSGIASRWLRVVIAALVVSGIASIGLAAFPMGGPGPSTFMGDPHQTAGTIGGVAQLLAALAFVLAIRNKRDWQPLVLPGSVAFGLALLGAVLTQMEIWWPRLGIPMGATMRLVVIPLVVLWGLVALRLRRVAQSTRWSAAR